MEKPDLSGNGYYLVHEETWEEGGEAYVEYFSYDERKKLLQRIKTLLNEEGVLEGQIVLIEGHMKPFILEREMVKEVKI